MDWVLIAEPIILTGIFLPVGWMLYKKSKGNSNPSSDPLNSSQTSPPAPVKDKDIPMRREFLEQLIFRGLGLVPQDPRTDSSRPEQSDQLDLAWNDPRLLGTSPAAEAMRREIEETESLILRHQDYLNNNSTTEEEYQDRHDRALVEPEWGTDPEQFS